MNIATRRSIKSSTPQIPNHIPKYFFAVNGFIASRVVVLFLLIPTAAIVTQVLAFMTCARLL